MILELRDVLPVSYALGLDVGNRSMRAAGRTVWNNEDWEAACAANARFLEAFYKEVVLWSPPT